MIVISLNDSAEFVLPELTSEIEAGAICIQLKERYLERNPNVSSTMVYYHWRDLPVWGKS